MKIDCFTCLNNKHFISIQFDWDDTTYYYPACMIITPYKAGRYVMVDNVEQLQQLYSQGLPNHHYHKSLASFPMWVEIESEIPEQAYYHPVVDNYDEAVSWIQSGFFKPKSSKEHQALYRHNMNNYSPSAKVLDLQKHEPSLPSIAALELIAEEIEKMTKQGVAFRPKS